MNEDKILNAKTPQNCFCVKCGKELTTEMKFCHYCGARNLRYHYNYNE